MLGDEDNDNDNDEEPEVGPSSKKRKVQDTVSDGPTSLTYSKLMEPHRSAGS